MCWIGIRSRDHPGILTPAEASPALARIRHKNFGVIAADTALIERVSFNGHTWIMRVGEVKNRTIWLVSLPQMEWAPSQ
jgi:hypothetical protein